MLEHVWCRINIFLANFIKVIPSLSLNHQADIKELKAKQWNCQELIFKEFRGFKRMHSKNFKREKAMEFWKSTRIGIFERRNLIKYEVFTKLIIETRFFFVFNI